MQRLGIQKLTRAPAPNSAPTQATVCAPQPPPLIAPTGPKKKRLTCSISESTPKSNITHRKHQSRNEHYPRLRNLTTSSLHYFWTNEATDTRRRSNGLSFTLRGSPESFCLAQPLLLESDRILCPLKITTPAIIWKAESKHTSRQDDTQGRIRDTEFQ